MTTRVSVIGTGYVGLILGACFAEIGHRVSCVDIDSSRVKRINDKISPIHEKGLQRLLDKHVGVNLIATTGLERSVLESDFTFITVGTPFDGENIDLSFIEEAAAQVGRAIRGKTAFHTVIIKSTVIPQTTMTVVKSVIEGESGKILGRDFGLAMNPEFLREGVAIDDFMNPDRIVIGGSDKRVSDLVKSLYDFFFDTDYILTDCTTAEMIKYTANSLLATLISFSNEIGNICASIGLDSKEVERGVHLDARFSPRIDGNRVMPSFLKYLEAGCGFGGSCFPKDVKALSSFGEAQSVEVSLLKSVIKINELQPREIVALLERCALNAKPIGKVLVLGAAFKADTDDVRESPSIPVVADLIDKGFEVSVYDPIAGNNFIALFDNEIVLEPELENAVIDKDAIILMTMWEEFHGLPEIISTYNPDVIFIDGRRQIAKDRVKNYHGIGLGW